MSKATAPRSNNSTPGCRNSSARCGDGDLAIFTADHGCDPTVPGTDHSREYVPLLVTRPARAARRRSRAARHAVRYRADGGRKFRRGDRARNQLFTANSMRKPIMAGNWKMYKTPAETTAFFEKFRPLVEKSEHCEIVICPPFTNLAAAVDAAQGHAHPDWRAEHRLGQRRRLHRRNLRPHDRGRGSHACHCGAQRTPPVFRRDRRDRAQADQGRARVRPDADRLRGRATGRARERAHRGGADPPVSDTASRA